jgi:hypothetical protein
MLSGTKNFLSLDFYRNSAMKERLNLIGAAEQHVLWKTRLGHHVRGTIREPLESALIGQDNICQLGVWINGSEFGHLHGSESYTALHAAHRQFHAMGDAIVERLQAGDRDGAEVLFNNGYSLAMTRIITALTAINRMVQCG